LRASQRVRRGAPARRQLVGEYVGQPAGQAAQAIQRAVALTFVLALLFVAGPFAMAWWPIPEASTLVRVWASVLIGALLVPVGWTTLFATAGALTLDATSFTGGAGSLPSHVAAAFAALITFVLAVM
jgi:hypothetical protein